MRLIAYLRVSSRTQLDGYGLTVQRTAIKRWAKANGHTITAEIIDEGVSGALEAADRPGLSDALQRLRKPPQAGGLVVAKLDRLARKLTTQEAILALIWREDGRVFTADDGELLKDDPDDIMRTAMRQMVGVFAELDRKTLVKRMRDGRKAKAADGKKATGQYAFGTTGVGKGRDRDAAPHPDEQKAVDRIVELRRAGESYRAIAATLDAEGLKTRRTLTLEAKALDAGQEPPAPIGWSAMSVRNVALRAGLPA